ncbi:MAG: transcription-repair coupling factor [Lachnospiraceae bacterium]|nr:transcription-repair coupling factor [Lachnospiraceae bacterium]
MRLLNSPLNELPFFTKLKRDITEHKHSLLCGCADPAKLHLISALSEGVGNPLILTYSERRAREIAEEYLFYDRQTLVYPAKDLIFYQADINGRETATERIKVLKRITSGEKGAVVTTIDALFSDCLPADVYRECVITLSKGSLLDIEAVSQKLVSMGYEKSYQAEAPGQFSVRGGILDVYDLCSDNPYRVELWGDEVDSLRSFDAESQRSIEELSEISIYPANEMILSETRRAEGYRRIKQESQKQIEVLRNAGKGDGAQRISLQLDEIERFLLYNSGSVNLESYLRFFYDREETGSFLKLYTEAPLIFLDEPVRLGEHGRAVMKEFNESMYNRLERGYVLPGQADILRSLEETTAELKRCGSVSLSALDSAEGFIGDEEYYSIHSRTLSSYNGSFSTLTENLKGLKKEGGRIVIVSASRSRAERLAQDLRDEGVEAGFSEDTDKVLLRGEVVTIYGRIHKGFTYPDIKLTVIAETDIFGAERRNRRKRPKYSGGKKISSYGELHVGDFVIHEDHGVGIYRGIEKIEVEHILKDYMKIEYRDGGSLYVLASSLDRVQLYADKDAGKKPKLNKLGGSEWTKTKAKVRASVAGVAKELVSLYAQRSLRHGYEFGEDTPWQREFEELFPYEETYDQMQAIIATKDDMESTKIMDRLICGDVGFGKTEVAIRAAFKAVQDGKQVAYLVPTTILAEQHFTTFVERMAAYPVRIAMLSRFRTPAQIKATLADLREGRIDIVIGTHRLLSKDVEYKDLGLLVIDEEQRFGVAHKEKIKQIKENVDVLTLTATPIPRTLHMSLVGIRDMSLLEEAPRDRLPIQTFVCEYDEEMVREAINRELSRGGQVYYVYNRVDTIQEMTAQVSALVPEARVSFAHGQMNERQLEDIMMAFIHREIDVLVATTIIETGLDIPNVNTMIIHDSDRMGLAQLYQLRGRVGRSDRSSYAFLMYRRDKVLKELAEKRLTAIREFTELGSGFKIAMRDLEIRGAGTLLGRQQHGHIESVGYDLYCKMLEEAVREEKGEKQEQEDVGCTIDLDVDAYLPPEYVVNEMQKLDLYKRIAQIADEADADAMRDELKDRFGALPKQVENLLRIALAKTAASSMYITEVRGRVGRIRVKMDRNAPVATEKIPLLINEYRGEMKLVRGPQPEFIYTYDIVGVAAPDEALLLENTVKMIESFKSLYPDRYGEA